MCKRTKDGDEGRWPRGVWRYSPKEISWEAVIITRLKERVPRDANAESADKDSCVLDITEYNDIDWTDICVPTNNSTQVKSEDHNVQKDIRDSSRLSLEISTESEERRSVSSVTAGTAEPEEHNTILEKESTCPIPKCRKRTKKP